MPTLDRFLIAPFNTGLQQNLRPWLIMDDAFSTLENAFVFRGRIRKRFGAASMGDLGQLSSRLRVQVGTYSAQASPVPGDQFNVGQMFSVGTDIFTVISSTPGAQLMLSTNPNGATSTFNVSTGAFVITYTAGAPAGSTPLYWYPSLPVMGITQYFDTNLNQQLSYAFDEQFAYVFNNGAWSRSGTPIWHGNNLNFFDVCNWEGATPGVIAMFVTNFNASTPTPEATDDPIWYTIDGTNWVAMTGGGGVHGIYFAPTGAQYTGPFVQTCRLIVAFHGRLLLLNTIENDGSAAPGVNTQYGNRCRFSFFGSPLARNAWYMPDTMDTSGGVVGGNNVGAGAGIIDAATDEQIVSAEFIKDRLIVFFERSTWEIVYNGAAYSPFVFQKINTELGSDAQNSSVPFDKEILTIGQTGVHSCNGSNTTRIDNKIPDLIFDIQDRNLGSQRVCGIRDYYAECVYWAYPTSAENPLFTYPDRILLYNYQNNSWAMNDDCITAFGYWEQNENTTWASSSPLTWAEANFVWNSGSEQQDFRQIIAGNQEGFMFVIRPDIMNNAPSLQITGITIVFGGLPNFTNAVVTLIAVDHTLEVGEFVYIQNAVGITNINGLIGKVTGVTNANMFQVTFLAQYLPGTLAGTYLGGGTITRVSNLNIISKQWNPYAKNGRNISVAKIDFAVLNTGIDATGNGIGQVTVDSFASSSIASDQGNAVTPFTLMSNGTLETGPYTLYPREKAQSTLWHPVYFSNSGSFIQIQIYWTDVQIENPQNAFSPFEIQGLVLYTEALSNRLE